MKENGDIDQSKTSFRNPDWILILGVEPRLECELVNVLLLGSALEILGCPGNWTDFFPSFFLFFSFLFFFFLLLLLFLLLNNICYWGGVPLKSSNCKC